ncbi:hypothetical protein JQ621_01655 [Bradyrhizobium manausense]|uniref:hypothetical protein n=1 Tax=Bradyrhizobium manausense TaxID=989370 RepID=UPI001BA48DDD|nr:hypothetical protein [Bradyrhizobium manausense]MBR1086175.1 hypothetical protein [Bradyrhizobium manausense]
MDFAFARILNGLQTFSGVSRRPRRQYARRKGETIDFIATDIDRMANGRIAEFRHSKTI